MQDDKQNASVYDAACSTDGDGTGASTTLNQNCARNYPVERTSDFRKISPCQRVSSLLTATPSNPNRNPNVSCTDIKRVSTTSFLETLLSLSCYYRRVCRSSVKQLQSLRISHTCTTSSITLDVSTRWDR